MKILTFGCSVIAIVLFCDSLHAGKITPPLPITIEPWMPSGWIKKNHTRCSGEYYKKGTNCEWIKKAKKR